MTPTQIARRSDALYEDNTGSMTRRVLCDMVAQRESDLEDARAESAKLRDGAYAMRQLYEDELKHALEENAKLRELALGEKWCDENYGCENLCPLYDKSEPEHCREERLLRELEIEVEE